MQLDIEFNHMIPLTDQAPAELLEHAGDAGDIELVICCACEATTPATYWEPAGGGEIDITGARVAKGDAELSDKTVAWLNEVHFDAIDDAAADPVQQAWVDHYDDY